MVKDGKKAINLSDNYDEIEDEIENLEVPEEDLVDENDSEDS